MEEENTFGNGEVQTNHAAEGETINIIRGEQKGKKGKVLIVRENTVIVRIGTDSETGDPIKTVVNHKNYKREE
ncbi:DUF2187 family protein [Virgibacillus ainsalahensis]